jgi:hypothetical protein
MVHAIASIRAAKTLKFLRLTFSPGEVEIIAAVERRSIAIEAAKERQEHVSARILLTVEFGMNKS